MLVISLTSIPPRFGQLPLVLTALAAQGADRVVLALPRGLAAPALPPGVALLGVAQDLGPATKLLPAARAYPGADILACDDDWLYRPGWAEAFRAARAAHPQAVIAGSSWGTERIGRTGGTVVQGFAGVLVAAELAAAIPDPPAEARAVDDIWISGHLAGLGARIVPAPGARKRMVPLASPDALQAQPDRDRDNRVVAGLIHQKFGIWAPAPPRGGV